jgi:hypothetical protein
MWKTCGKLNLQDVVYSKTLANARLRAVFPTKASVLRIMHNKAAPHLSLGP